MNDNAGRVNHPKCLTLNRAPLRKGGEFLPQIPAFSTARPSTLK